MQKRKTPKKNMLFFSHRQRLKGEFNMLDYIQNRYEFSNYQMAQLKYFFRLIFSEGSKFILMGIFFHRELALYVFATFLLLFLRSSTGGLHCKTYYGCFLLSFGYLFLAIRILPLLPINKLSQLFGLLVCILINYYVGPVSCKGHPVLSSQTQFRVRLQAFVFIFFYFLLTYLGPENGIITVGFWVIILHTAQLAAAKIFQKGE